jgi:lipid-A-disaccharide synthase
MLILISAGEASGEMYGAQLIEALRKKYVGTAAPGCLGERSSPVSSEQKPAELRSARTSQRPVPTQALGQPGTAVPTLSFFGVGGERMRAAGCDTIIDAKDLAVVGITEILSHLPKILGLYKNLIREADRNKPDLAIVIDSPAFNWRVARQMKKRGIPTVYYVAPQFWAWRQGRVRLIRNYIDKALVIFPFEEQFYRDRGVDATFVGHPLADLPNPAITREEYAAQFRLDPKKHWITLMPGSRVKEVHMNLPTIVDAARMLGDQYEFLLPVAPTLSREFLVNVIRGYEPQALRRRELSSASAAPAKSCPSQDASPPRVEQLEGITLVDAALPALWHSRAGIIASGTATVEAAMMNTPFVMVYRVSRLTYLLGKPRVKVPRFAMVNLIAGEEVVPELVQHDFTAGNVVARIQEILPDGPARTRMLEGLASVRTNLRALDTTGLHQPPADRAAEIILSLFRPKSA